MLTKWTNNFTAGEWSPVLDARSDLERYGASCQRLENLRVLSTGGVSLRGGLEFIGECKKGNAEVRLMPFVYSTGVNYVLELGDRYIRVWRGGVLRADLWSPYPADVVFGVQSRQINDWMYLVCGDYPVHKLVRNSETSWVLSEVSWDYAPMRDENTARERKLSVSVSGVGEVGQMSASGFSPFMAGHVGSYWELRQLNAGGQVNLGLNLGGGGDGESWPQTAFSGVLRVWDEWELTTTEFWYGELGLQRKLQGESTWRTIRRWYSQADRNVTASGRELEKGAEYRLEFSAHGWPYNPPVWNNDQPSQWRHANALLETKSSYQRGLVRVSGYVSPTSVNVEVVQELSNTGWTSMWSEGAWSGARGYPRAVAFFEQRLFFGGTKASPVRFWGSKSADFENFERGDKDDAGLSFEIASSENNPIMWMAAGKRLMVGTSGYEYAVGSSSLSEPLTPTNVKVEDAGSNGASWVGPVRAGEKVLFIQRQHRKLRELGYDLGQDGYSARDLSQLADHLFEDGSVVQLAYSLQPDPLLYGPFGGEFLPVLTYDGELGVFAWGRYVTGGARGPDRVESVCSVYGDPADEVWCVVRRNVGGVWRRLIERFAPEARSYEAGRYLDCHRYGVLGLGWDGGVPVGGHLNGERVRLVIGGEFIESKEAGGYFTVIGGGIHVPAKARDLLKAKWGLVESGGAGESLRLRTYCVGLPYRGVLETSRLEIEGQEGSSAGKARRVGKVVSRFYDTGGRVRVGREWINFRRTPDLMDGAVPLFSGDKEVTYMAAERDVGAGVRDSQHDREGRVRVEVDSGAPFTLLGVSVSLNPPQG